MKVKTKMKVKTDKLIGPALDWAVAKLINPDIGNTVPYYPDGSDYAPSLRWAHGGPIIEQEKLGVWWAPHIVDDEGNEFGGHWFAETGCTDENPNETYYCYIGPTPLIAAMRCYVAAKLGSEVYIPEELVVLEKAAITI